MSFNFYNAGIVASHTCSRTTVSNWTVGQRSNHFCTLAVCSCASYIVFDCL